MRRLHSPALVLALALFSSAALGAQQQYTPDELKEMGRRSLARAQYEYGSEKDPEIRRDVGTVIDAIKVAAQFRDEVVWDVIADSDLNASAAPGGVMIVNVGVANFCKELTDRRAGDAAATRQRYMGCLAAVIGHEFGHLALGHTDSVATTIARRQEIARRENRASSVVEAITDSILMHGLRIERTRELEADRAGALFALRSGWSIQDAVDLFMAMDSMSRAGSRWRGQLTWLIDHPRSSERAAMLDAYRARLRLHQRDFDDALALLDHDIMLDSAIAMLTRIQIDFPGFAAVSHARAVAIARKWLASATVQELRVRPSLPAYDAAFQASIKGANASLLRAARQGFVDAMRSNAHPYTMSALAVMDAYSGDTSAARQRAGRATSAMPDDPEVFNDAGVVHFLAGRYSDARQAFLRAVTLSGDDPSPQVLFNLGKTAAAMGDSRVAKRYLEEYLEIDDSSGWAEEAQAMLAKLDGNAGRTSAPSGGAATGGDSRLPTIGGIRLGGAPQQALAALGNPSGSDQHELGAVWRYPERGMILIVHPSSGVRVIMLTSPNAGEIAGVRVGMPSSAAYSTLGAPMQRDVSGAGTTYYYDRGGWAMAMVVRDGVVQTLSARADDR